MFGARTPGPATRPVPEQNSTRADLVPLPGGATALEGSQRGDGGPPASPGPASGTGTAEGKRKCWCVRLNKEPPGCGQQLGVAIRLAVAVLERVGGKRQKWPGPWCAGIRLAGATSDVHIMDVRSGKWERMMPQGEPPSPRAAHAAAAVGSMVVVQARSARPCSHRFKTEAAQVCQRMHVGMCFAWQHYTARGSLDPAKPAASLTLQSTSMSTPHA